MGETPRRQLAWERRRRKTWKGGAHPRHAESAEHGLRIVAVARGAAGGGADDTRLTTTQSPYGRGPALLAFTTEHVNVTAHVTATGRRRQAQDSAPGGQRCRPNDAQAGGAASLGLLCKIINL